MADTTRRGSGTTVHSPIDDHVMQVHNEAVARFLGEATASTISPGEATASTTTTPTEQSLRYNTGKPRLSLIDSEATLELARVLTMGAAKYADNNWRVGMPWTSVVDSLERHVAAFKGGQDTDTESGLQHMAHVMCNAMFLIWYHNHRREYDDRYGSTAP